jgi:hypothetical protein
MYFHGRRMFFLFVKHGLFFVADLRQHPMGVVGDTVNCMSILLADC